MGNVISERNGKNESELELVAEYSWGMSIDGVQVFMCVCAFRSIETIPGKNGESEKEERNVCVCVCVSVHLLG